jgi:hypothetical protein
VSRLQTGQAEDLVFSLPDDLEPDTIIEIHGYTPAGKGSKRVARYKHRVTDEMELVKEPVGT